MKAKPSAGAPAAFTGYQKFVVAILAFLQFTLILDFMILSPLGALLMPQLHITTRQFGLVVSAYAFSAGASGLLAAGFADRFDRKRLLLFFYAGFLLGTLFCGLAPSYPLLLAARVVTGAFGGVIGSVSFAIIIDLFPLETRGRVMGLVQTAFAASQVLGIPLGLYLANHGGWHIPFLVITAVGLAVGVAIALRLRPITGHLALQTDRGAFSHLFHTVTNSRYLLGFLNTIFLVTGGYMLMPFGSAFSVHNLGIDLDHLTLVYLVTGLSSIAIGPLAGKLADSQGKYPTFLGGTLLGMVVVLYYTRLGHTPLWWVMAVNVVLFAAISARMVSSQALISALPEPRDRGAYMSVNSSIQQVSGGVASALAGMIVVERAGGYLGRYEVLGYVVAGAMIATMLLMYYIDKQVARKPAPARPAADPAPVAAE